MLTKFTHLKFKHTPPYSYFEFSNEFCNTMMSPSHRDRLKYACLCVGHWFIMLPPPEWKTAIDEDDDDAWSSMIGAKDCRSLRSADYDSPLTTFDCDTFFKLPLEPQQIATREFVGLFKQNSGIDFGDEKRLRQRRQRQRYHGKSPVIPMLYAMLLHNHWKQY